MAIIKYAVISSDNGSVGFVGFFDTSTGSFSAFQASYNAANPTRSVVDITGSQFPDGQGWQFANNQYTPTDGAFRGVAEVKAKVCAQVSSKTSQIEYAGFVTFRDKQFPRDHSTRDAVVLLANSVGSSAALASTLLPLKVNAIDFSELTIETVADAQDFALAMLQPLKAVYAAQAEQMAAVQAMTNITQLVQYIDPR